MFLKVRRVYVCALLSTGQHQALNCHLQHSAHRPKLRLSRYGNAQGTNGGLYADMHFPLTRVLQQEVAKMLQPTVPGWSSSQWRGQAKAKHHLFSQNRAEGTFRRFIGLAQCTGMKLSLTNLTELGGTIQCPVTGSSSTDLGALI